MITLSIINGNTGFVLHGAGLVTDNIQPGSQVIANGSTHVISAIDDDKCGHFAAPCPSHAAGTRMPAVIVPMMA